MRIKVSKVSREERCRNGLQDECLHYVVFLQVESFVSAIKSLKSNDILVPNKK